MPATDDPLAPPADAGAGELGERVVSRAESAIAEATAGDPLAARLLAAALAPAAGVARRHPTWPALAVPIAVGGAYGLPAAASEAIAAACMLWFASADVIDDAQDGDLADEPWGGWPHAVGAGLTLLFLSQRTALAAASPAVHGELARAFAEAGVAMSLGQGRDLAQRGSPAEVGGEADYLACVRGKTGGSIALFATLPAIAAGAPPTAVRALHAWGEATGAALQLASDLADLRAPASRDRRAGRVTLPVQRAWARLPVGDRGLLEAAWRGEPGAPDLGFLLQRTGALAHARARLGALRIEARDALTAGGPPPPVPAELAERLAAWTDVVASGDGDHAL